MSIDSVILALTVAFLLGIAPVLHKMVLGKNLSIHTAIVLSAAFYMIVAIAYTWIYRDVVAKDISTITSKQIYYLAFTAIICSFVAKVLYFMVLEKHDSYVVSALMYSSPAFTLVCAYLILKEKITMTGFVGVFLIVIGIMMLAYSSKTQANTLT